ncbi:hypothetical protein Desac_0518 [Desulfobacca acetoxidans DSM 11109]|uniref:Uncharacterized protein n=1 Tax=Desulfobacca acetoxidans (strain ATCC 700848 / DSM 11109 / ASRB2) TaxID=880072 RepID=F2NFZ1_DESAR|nr:hypothetical protein Desac_0518 [Desulfobacca acetoxidans DSM 11109]
MAQIASIKVRLRQLIVNLPRYPYEEYRPVEKVLSNF